MSSKVVLTESYRDYWLQEGIYFHIELMVCFNNYYREVSEGSRDKKILGAYIEVALIKARMLLEVMGLCYIKGELNIKDICKMKPTDISAIELGRQFIALSHLDDEKKQLLKRVFHFANKYVAHLTNPEYYYTDTNTLIKAFDLVMVLINKYLYCNKTGR